MECIYKILLTVFSYKPTITVQQFFATGFAERKILLCLDICALVRQMHNELSKTSMPKASLRKPVRTEEVYQPGTGHQEEKPGGIKVVKHTAPELKALTER